MVNARNSDGESGGFNWVDLAVDVGSGLLEDYLANEAEQERLEQQINLSNQRFQVQQNAQQQALDFLRGRYDRLQQQLQPFYNPAVQAFNEQLRLVGINPNQRQSLIYPQNPRKLEATRELADLVNERNEILQQAVSAGYRPSNNTDIPMIQDRSSVDMIGNKAAATGRAVPPWAGVSKEDSNAAAEQQTIQNMGANLPPWSAPMVEQSLMETEQNLAQSDGPNLPPWASPSPARPEGLPPGFADLETYNRFLELNNQIDSINKEAYGDVPYSRFESPEALEQYQKELQALNPDAGMSGGMVDPYAQIVQSPIYQGLADQQEEAILQAASATGGLRGGNVQDVLARSRPQLVRQLTEDQFRRLGQLSRQGLGAAVTAGTTGGEGDIASLMLTQGQTEGQRIQQIGQIQEQSGGGGDGGIGWGAVAGSVIGSFFPGVGTAVGGAIGSFIDSIF